MKLSNELEELLEGVPIETLAKVIDAVQVRGLLLVKQAIADTVRHGDGIAPLTKMICSRSLIRAAAGISLHMSDEEVLELLCSDRAEIRKIVAEEANATP